MHWTRLQSPPLISTEDQAVFDEIAVVSKDLHRTWMNKLMRAKELELTSLQQQQI